MRLQVPALFFSVLSLSIFASSQAGGSASLLVLSKQDHTVAIVDPSTLKVMGKAPVGEDPHEIVASADGRTAYVSNYGFGRFHTITVIDLVNKKREKVIDLARP